MGKNITKTPNGSYTVTLYLKEDERKMLNKLGSKLEKNDFETLKYCLQLVSWWSRNQIEPEEA